jgi:L-iditol 2-dehydrogenase
MAECRAAVVTGFNQPSEIRSVPIPELEPTALLMRVDAATLCGTDVHCWHGRMSSDSLPYIPGHETTGVIVDMNGARSDLLGEPLNEGDRIISTYPHCGHCYYCTVAGEPTRCSNSYAFGRVLCDQPPYLLGGCAEYHYVPPGCDIVRVPAEVPSPLAASAACSLRTIMHGFERLGPLATHETVLVQGCGPVGLYALAVARDRGARKVLVIGAPDSRLQVAREWGADATLNLDEHSDVNARREWALDHTEGRGPDVVIQCATAAAIPEGLEIVRPRGRYLTIGGGDGNITVSANALRDRQIIGVGGSVGRHFYQAVTFLATRQKDFAFEGLISGVYSLDGVSQALQAMAEFREVKPVVFPNT